MAETKITRDDERDNNYPNGFLINGVIAPTVTSDDLTVAIKTLAGNDPSADDPAYIRIDNVFREITSALSVTAAAGTNWFNAGSSELATEEIDYFVYLAYSTTNGVIIGFARKVGNIKDDFSLTSTQETHLEVSAEMDSFDDTATIIGRFAATLSAGAGYTWTVPSFLADNLIQRPIFETRWLEATVTFNISYLDDGSGGQPGTRACRYKMSREKIQGTIEISGKKVGSGENVYLTSLPFGFSNNCHDYIGIGTALNAYLGITGVLCHRVSDTDSRIYMSTTMADNDSFVGGASFDYEI